MTKWRLTFWCRSTQELRTVTAEGETPAAAEIAYRDRVGGELALGLNEQRWDLVKYGKLASDPWSCPSCSMPLAGPNAHHAVNCVRYAR